MDVHPQGNLQDPASMLTIWIWNGMEIHVKLNTWSHFSSTIICYTNLSLVRLVVGTQKPPKDPLGDILNHWGQP